MIYYLLHLAVLTLIYATLSTALDLVVGHAGMFSIAQAAFWGLGAYTTGVLAVRTGAPFLVGCVAGVALASIMAIIVSIPALRLSDEFFLIATFGYQSVTFSILNNWTNVTGGPLGIAGPRIFPTGNGRSDLIVTVVLCVLCCALLFRVSSSSFGRVLHVIREDPSACAVLGKNPLTFRIKAFVLSACISAMMGALFASYMSYVDPSSFTVSDSILILSMVIIGGAGSTYGPLLGSILLIALGELTRFTGLPGAAAANIRQITYGVLLIATLLVRPRGLAGKFDFLR
jgi:branched-chain amino acid transport system permease protein